MKKIKQLFRVLFTKQEKEHSERFNKTMDFLNKYSLLFHLLLSCFVVFIVEFCSRHSFMSAGGFAGHHLLAFLFNAFIVFASLTLVYLFRRRMFVRLIICGFWVLLGVINGCVLSNRVTPFGFSDLKCIPDLLTMSNTSYFTAEEAAKMVMGIVAFLLFCVVVFIKGPRYQGKIHKIYVPLSICAFLLIGVPVTSQAAQSTNIVSNYFANIAQGYENYGFIYGFSSSVVDRGMSKPSEYKEENVDKIMAQLDAADKESTVNGETGPNVIVVLMESFIDPDEVKFLDYDVDPVPTYHMLEQNYSSGYLTVPVIGAGTANTEFEILTGMQLIHFGTGEYPYKTILKKSDCESYASAFHAVDYGTHVVHNNGGNFYSRVNAFSMMGFDSFTSKELMDITEYTPLGSWPLDDILVSETMKTLDATPDQADFTYTITVGTHGDYPEEVVIEEPYTTIAPLESEGLTNQWTYYLNMLHNADRFMADLIAACEARDEETLIIFYGDHLPTMGLTEEDMLTGDIYKTNYVTWNNFGLEKEDTDLYAYQLVPHFADIIGVHEGTIMSYHQTQQESETYLEDLELLQYDILYGKRFCYENREVPYMSSDIVMGIDEVVIQTIGPNYSHTSLMIYGSGFTKWSRVYVNGEKVRTVYQNGTLLSIDSASLEPGDTIQVFQVGSSNSLFRGSNVVTYGVPDSAINTESTEDVQ